MIQRNFLGEYYIIVWYFDMLPSSIAKINIDIRSFKMSRYYLKILDFPFRINYMLIRTLKKKWTFSVSPMFRVSIYLKLTSWISKRFYHGPWNFPFFLHLWNFFFPLKFWDSLWKFNDFYSTSWNFELISSTRGRGEATNFCCWKCWNNMFSREPFSSQITLVKN